MSPALTSPSSTDPVAGLAVHPEDVVLSQTRGDPSPLDTSGFDFSQFEQLGFITSSGPTALTQTHPVPLDGIPQVSDFQTLWTQPPQAAHVLSACAQEHQLLVQSNDPFDAAFEQARQLQVTTHSQSQSQVQGGKRRRARLRNRPRQIALRHIAHGSLAAADRGQPNIHWMAQLNDINARLLDLSSVLHQQQHLATYNGQAVEHNASESAGVHGFPIDEMFKLTGNVADILDRLPAKGSGESLSSAAAARMDTSDPGNSMFVLATYVRLLDMYQKVFGLVRLEVSQGDVGTAFRSWHLPDVQVGSFAVESSPSLQMSLTVQLAEEFLCRLRAATALLGPTIANGGKLEVPGLANNKSMFSDVVDVSFRAVKTKEDCLGKHLAELRDEIEALLDG